jgi:multidrug efflux pump subunit AcrB
MPDVVGRYFREFGVTMATAIVASGIVALVLTPMLCSRLLGGNRQRPTDSGSIAQGGSQAVALYMRTLDWALAHPIVFISVLLLMVMGTAGLFIVLPKGFMPTQDTGILAIRTVTTANVSFDAMDKLQRTVSNALLREPSVEGLASYIGTDNGSPLNNGYITVSLKSLEQRKASIEQVVAHMRDRLARIAGIRTFFKPWQDLQLGVENSASRYQYTLIGSNPNELLPWSEVMRRQMLAMPQLTDVISTAEVAGLEANLIADRKRAAAFGVTQVAINNTLYDAFGQRQIATIYLPFNYSRVILEVDRAFQKSPAALRNLFVLSASTPQSSSLGSGSTQTLIMGSANGRVGVLGAAPSSTSGIAPSGTSSPQTQASATVAFGGNVNAEIPLSTIMRFGRAHAAMWLRHSEQFPSITISFDTIRGVSIGEAINSIRAAQARVHLPDDIKAEFRGEAAEASKIRLTQALLFAAAIFTIYVVLGMLYESYSHPFTILTTLPSAGFGALLALVLAEVQFTIITAIACILVLGIVMKNAIMMVDFALAAQRRELLAPRDAIKHAARLRVRPIVMTTLVTILSTIPIAVSTGAGHELRQPLGIAAFGGLVVSQVLTLYTTPVIYLLVERLRAWRRPPVAT